MTTSKSKLLGVLTPAEQDARYGLPDFDDAQRLDFLHLSEPQLALSSSRPGLHAQAWCALQIGYFKAKQTFFRFAWDDVQDDTSFVLSRYFNGHTFTPRTVTKHEHYAQRALIAKLFDYRLWSSEFLAQLASQAAQIVRRDVTPGFIVAELIVYLNENKVERPGYTAFQRLISHALSDERRRLGVLLGQGVDEGTKVALSALLVREDTLSELAALKQDAKDFGWRQMIAERDKISKLKPLYMVAKKLLPKLGVSQQNLHNYASLANFYTVYDLRRMKPEQAQLYLLCYAWQRFRQIIDNLVDAQGYHMKKLEDESKMMAEKEFVDQQIKRQQESPRVGRVLLLYVDDTLSDTTPFGEVRRRAFKILPKDEVQGTGERLSSKAVTRLALRWQAIDRLAPRVRRHMRPLYDAVDLSATAPDCPWLAALTWMKGVFANHQRLSQRPTAECPEDTLPKRFRQYLLVFDEKGNPTGVQADRYEFWIYRQLRKRLKSGEIYLDDSRQHRHLNDELVAQDRQAQVLEDLDTAWARQPIDEHLAGLGRELRKQWRLFNRDLRRGKLTHLDFDHAARTLTWRQPEAVPADEEQSTFYEQLPFCETANVLRFVNDECGFLAALTPLQPRYAKQVADTDSLLAVLVAQAMNYGNLLMSRTSDIPYHVLEATYQQYMRLASLQDSNDCISNAIAQLPIFGHYSFDVNTLYGGVDGQKFGVDRPTVKARYSSKYFGRGKGVVAYTLLCNHVPLQGWLIGAHELEAHYAFDIWYRNTSEILPTAITGDMHSVNKANFAIFHWFEGRFEPRFTNVNDAFRETYCTDDPARYDKFLMRPAGQIDLQGIATEKSNMDRIVATLALKEMTQGTLIRKLCTYSESNPTRRAIFEFDRLIRSIYTLRYMRDPQLQRNVHRSQNRVESYHQLRGAIAQVGGKKELTGRTDLEVEISNQCGRLVANATVYYNSAILSKLLTKFEASGDQKVLELIKTTSPVAWRHLLLNGRYNFRGGVAIDLDALVRGLNLQSPDEDD